MYKILTLLISLIPIQSLKVFLYNLIGIHIDKKCNIGFLVCISSKKAVLKNTTIESLNFIFANNILINDCKIMKANFFTNISKLEFDKSFIGNFNKFISDKKHQKKNNNLIIKSTQILNRNLFDISSDIFLEDVKINNFNQFWTHGFDVFRKIDLGDIEIKNDVVINNNVIILPGVKIKNKITIHHGCIVHKNLSEPGEYKSNLICKF